MSRFTVEIYTDGAARNNADPQRRMGAFGWLMVCPELNRLKFGNRKIPTATNNQMEVMAVIKALESIKDKGAKITIYSDSQYVIGFATSWRYKWKAKGWNVKKENLTLLRLLSDLIDSFTDIAFEKVKGHSGIEGNEMADLLCNCALDDVMPYDHPIFKMFADRYKI